MFYTDAQIASDVADALHIAGGSANLQAFWLNVVQRCHTRAFNDIVGLLISRKYTLAQINSWDELGSYERDLSLFYCFMSPQGQGQFDKAAVEAWDIRPQLKTLTLVINGVFTAPSTASPGESSVGEIGIGRIGPTVPLVPPCGPNPNRYDSWDRDGGRW